MNSIIVYAVFLMLIVVVYVFLLRKHLREYPWFDPFYDWIEPIERRLWDKSRTMLIARLYSLIGFVLSLQALIQESGIDWLSLIPIPSEYSKWVGPALWITGLIFAHLRKITVKTLTERKDS